MREICHSNNISARHTGNTFSIYSFPFFVGLISFLGTCKEIIIFLQGTCDVWYVFRIKGWLKLFKGQSQAGLCDCCWGGSHLDIWLTPIIQSGVLECLYIFITEYIQKNLIKRHGY